MHSLVLLLSLNVMGHNSCVFMERLIQWKHKALGTNEPLTSVNQKHRLKKKKKDLKKFQFSAWNFTKSKVFSIPYSFWSILGNCFLECQIKGALHNEQLWWIHLYWNWWCLFVTWSRMRTESVFLNDVIYSRIADIYSSNLKWVMKELEATPFSLNMQLGESKDVLVISFSDFHRLCLCWYHCMGLFWKLWHWLLQNG